MNIPLIEQLLPEHIEAYQAKRLRELMAYLDERSPFYRRKFRQEGIDPARIRQVSDLSRISVTTKDDLQQYNEEFWCVPRQEIVDYVCTSGTLGTPVTVVLTDNDLKRLAYNEYLSLGCTGGGPDETYQLTTTIDRRFMAGMAYFMGARQLGAGIIRVGSGVPGMQWDTIHRLRPTALIGVPSFFLKLLDYAETSGIDPGASSVRKLICIGEGVRRSDFSLSSLGQRLHDGWGLPLFASYASTEMGASFTECEHGRGGHHHPELLIIELLDENDRPVPPGQPGELTITTLGVEGMPLLRFKTGDVCVAHTEPCACGRSTMRLGPLTGRKQQMLKFKGTTLYPQAIYDALNTVKSVKNYVVEAFSNSLNTDEVVVHVGSDEPSETFVPSLQEHLRAKLRVMLPVRQNTVEHIHRIQFPENARKPILFIDRRAS